MKFFNLTLFVFLFASSVRAQEVFDSYNNARSLAMGGTMIAVVNDETALLGNPAALGRLRDSYGTLIDPEFDSSVSTKKMYDSNPFTNPFDLTQIKDAADSSRESYYYSRAQVFPSYVARNFGIGIFGIKEAAAKMNSAGDNLTLNYRDDLSIHLGVNLRLFDGKVKIGAVGKAIGRIEVAKDISMPGSLDLSQVASEGVGLGFDAGIILSAPVAGLPTLSAVVRDVGSTPFTGGSGVRMQSSSRPETLEQDIDVALAFFPIHGNRSRSAFSLEYKKIKQAAESTDKQRFYHVGYEYNYGDLLFFRLGMNQRYWTAGFELATEHTQWQLSSYGEEIGVNGNTIEDRRYVLKFAFRF
jgi:hypothetical protein